MMMSLGIAFFQTTKASGKLKEVLQSERRSRERLYKVILNLGKLSSEDTSEDTSNEATI